MDPLTFATLVGLICAWRQERSLHAGEKAASEERSYKAFEVWLRTHQHEQLSDQIAASHYLQEQIDQLLRQNHADLSAKLNSVETLITQVLSRLEGFDKIAKTIHPELVLSEDAWDTLKEFVDWGATSMYVDFNKNQFHYDKPNADGAVPVWAPSDPRFFSDDMETLTGLGFVTCLGGRAGTASFVEFRLTRSGSEYVTKTRKDGK